MRSLLSRNLLEILYKGNKMKISNKKIHSDGLFFFSTTFYPQFCVFHQNCQNPSIELFQKFSESINLISLIDNYVQNFKSGAFAEHLSNKIFENLGFILINLF